MENIIKKFYQTLLVLRSAQDDVRIISTLYSHIQHYDRYPAINALSYIFVTYEKEFNRISDLLTSRPIKIAKDSDPATEYDKSEKTDQDIKDDIIYAIDCLIIIFAVKQNLASSIDDAILKIKNG